MGWAVDDEVSIEPWHAVPEFAVGDTVSTEAGDTMSTLDWAVDDEVSIEPWHAGPEFAVGDAVSTEAGDAVSTLEWAVSCHCRRRAMMAACRSITVSFLP